MPCLDTLHSSFSLKFPVQEGFFSKFCNERFLSGHFVEKATGRLKTKICTTLITFEIRTLTKLEAKSVVK